MEDLCYQFPHVAEMILKDLDDQSLIKSIEASRELDIFLNNDRIYWIRVLAKHKSNFIQFKDSWKRCLHQVPVVIIKELAIAVHHFFQGSESACNRQWSPLHIIADNGSLELYEYISGKCGSLDHVGDKGQTALHMAAGSGQLEIMTFIIDNLQGHNQSVASCRIAEVPRQIVCDQVNKNPENRDGTTPLHYAALSGHFEICTFIMNLLTNKNPREKDGSTPLHFAAQNGHVRTYKLIMACLVDKNPANNSGVTPLHLASYCGHLGIIKLVMGHLQNKNPEDINGWTPLQVAVDGGHLDIVKLFVEQPDVKILGDDSYTFLHSAARYGSLALCKLLIENSKDKNYADRNGWTPLHYAAINGHFAICELLIPYFGDKCHFSNVWNLGHFAMKNGDSRFWQEIGKGLKSVGPKTNDGTTPLQLMVLNFDVMKTI